MAINGFLWERSFSNLDTNEKVYLFNKAITNVILHKNITFDNTDQHKHLINEKNAAYKNYLKNNKSDQSFAMF